MVNEKKNEFKKYLPSADFVLLPEKGPGPERLCLEPAVVGGFLTLCRKDFSAQVRVTTRIHLLNLGSIKGELSIEGATGEPRLSCLCSLVSQRKGGLVGGTGSGLAWDKLPEFRRRMPVGKEAGVGGNGWHQLLLRGRT